MRAAKFLKLTDDEAIDWLKERIGLARGEHGRFPLDTYQLWKLDPEMFQLVVGAPAWRVRLDRLGIGDISGEVWDYPHEDLFPFLVARASHFRRRGVRAYSFDDWLGLDEAGMRHAIRNDMLKRIARKMRWKLEGEYTVAGKRK